MPLLFAGTAPLTRRARELLKDRQHFQWAPTGGWPSANYWPVHEGDKEKIIEAAIGFTQARDCLIWEQRMASETKGAEIVWGGMTQDALDAAYDQAVYAANMQQIFARWEAHTALTQHLAMQYRPNGNRASR